MARERHTLNGKLLGIFYTTEQGRQVYLAHRQMRHLNRHYNGWSIDTTTLSKCKARGLRWVGVVARRDGKKHVWITEVEDFFHPEKSFKTVGKLGYERGVRLTHFKLDPANDAGKIDAALKIR
jgi:hypothetical protein